MNMNTITQELNKKISKMSKDDFNNFIERLYKVWYKHHKSEISMHIHLSKYDRFCDKEGER